MPRPAAIAAPLAALAALFALPALVPFAAAPAQAADNGLYVGGALGRGGTEFREAGFEVDGTEFGWKVFAGLRPIEWFAAEVAYVDLGRPERTVGGVRTDLRTRGPAAFVNFYVPFVPIVDVYAKAGLARLDSELRAGAFRLDRTDTEFAWGVGAGLGFGSASVRLEYERFRTRNDRPDLISLGVLWTFL